MEQVRRSALTTEQQRELWRRWRAGESLHEIARAFGRRASSIHGMIAAHGGYVPAARRRSPRVLSLGEREEISRGLAAGASLRLIARRLGRAPSTVSREVARHGGRRRYRALRADERAWRRARRPKPCKLAARAAAARAGRRQARRAVVPGADLRLACADLRRRAGSAGVHRDDLPQPLRADARRARQGADRPAAHAAHDAPLEAGEPQGRAAASSGTGSPSASARPRSRTAPCPATGRATCWSARRTRTSPPWSSARPASCSSSSSTAGTATTVVAALAAQVQTLPASCAEPHLGPRRGARRAPALQRRHRRRRLLLRPALALAARHQREHQRAPAPVLPQADGPGGPHAG